tara:strand:+ start:2922 stop:3446 length:525 start_codon:yes stop_codon:yes gene_type:complete
MNEVFKTHPNLKKYFKTSDGVKFYDEDAAKTHARTLENRTVETVHRTTKVQEIADKIIEAKKAVDDAADKKKSKGSKNPETQKTEATTTAKTEKKKAAKVEDSGTVDSKELTPMAAAKLRKEAIEKLDSIAEIEKALEGETAQSVIKAGNERIAAIKATDALDSEEENPNVQTQ